LVTYPLFKTSCLIKELLVVSDVNFWLQFDRLFFYLFISKSRVIYYYTWGIWWLIYKSQDHLFRFWVLYYYNNCSNFFVLVFKLEMVLIFYLHWTTGLMADDPLVHLQWLQQSERNGFQKWKYLYPMFLI